MSKFETELQEAELVIKTVAALWEYIGTLPTDPQARIQALEDTLAKIDALLSPQSGS